MAKTALGTLASRILGLIREVVNARYFGTTWQMDMFFLAFTVPNLFRRLFGEGALNAAFIPAFAEEGTRADGNERQLFHVVMTALAALLTAITFAGWIVCGVALWAAPIAEKWRLFWFVLAVMLPYLPLICLTALQGATLNVKGYFFIPAVAPTIMNVCWIAAALFFGERFGVKALAVGVLISGALQYAVQVPLLWKCRLKLKWVWDLAHPGLRKVTRKMLPAAFGLGLVQVNTAVDRLIAQFCVPGDGANSALVYGNDLMQFPLGVLGMALATAVLPSYSRLAAQGDRRGLGEAVNLGLRTAFFVALPCVAVIAALSGPMVRVLFERGAFTPESTERTARVFLYFSAGLWAFCSVHVLARAFYALGDTVTPVKIAAVLVAANLALNLTLVWTMREAGLALASSICGVANMTLLFVYLRRRIGPLGGSSVARSAAKCAAAAAVAGVAGYAVACALGLSAGQGATMTQALALGAAIAAAGAAFVLAAWALRVREMGEFIAAVAMRKTPAG